LAIETRPSGDGYDACRTLDHEPTRWAVTAERGLLAELGGGCQVPIGAHASVHGNEITLMGVVASPDGLELVRGQCSGAVAHAEQVGRALGGDLLDRGARRILETVYGR
jgi:hydroxymethylbilane synthase